MHGARDRGLHVRRSPRYLSTRLHDLGDAVSILKVLVDLPEAELSKLGVPSHQ